MSQIYTTLKIIPTGAINNARSNDRARAIFTQKRNRIEENIKTELSKIGTKDNSQPISARDRSNNLQSIDTEGLREEGRTITI